MASWPYWGLPEYRGKGIGSRLMQIFCKQVDSCSAMAYLETDLDENVRFYDKFGFKVVSESRIFNIENRYMTRQAKHII